MNVQVIENMADDEYHALERLSASGIKKLLTSAQDFWHWSWFNPNRCEEKSDTLNLGTAYHKRILEGLEAFNKCYAVKDKVDGRTKEGKAYNEQWRLDNPDAEPISQDIWAQIANAKAHLHVMAVEGKPEVTYLWDDQETNVPMKARIDYLTADRCLDLKTFSNSSGADPLRVIAGQIPRYGYHIQAAVYSSITGKPFTFIFQQTGPANNCIVRHFPDNLLLADQGRQLMRKGINKFADMYRKFGKEQWFDEWETGDLQDADFPLWTME